MSQTVDGLDVAKKAAAVKAVDNHVKNGFTVGIGSGTTIIHAIQRIKQNKLDVQCIGICPTTLDLILENGLKLTDLSTHPELDVFIDGFDEVEISTKSLIVGACGRVAAVKIAANASKQIVFIADNSKQSQRLGQVFHEGIPIEVIPVAAKRVAQEVEKLFKGNAVLRVRTDSVEPFVFLNENKNHIIDWMFTDDGVKGRKWDDIYRTIKLMSGVVDVGLVLNDKSNITVYLGAKDGHVDTL